MRLPPSGLQVEKDIGLPEDVVHPSRLIPMGEYLPSLGVQLSIHRPPIPDASGEQGYLGVKITGQGLASVAPHLESASQPHDHLCPHLDVLDSLESVQAAPLDEPEIPLPHEHVYPVGRPVSGLGPHCFHALLVCRVGPGEVPVPNQLQVRREVLEPDGFP